MEKTKNNFFFFFTQFVHYLFLYHILTTHPATSLLVPSKSLFLLLTFPSLFPIHLFPLPNLYYPPLKFSFFLHLFLFLSLYSTSSDSSSTRSTLPTSPPPYQTSPLLCLILVRFFRSLPFS